MSSEGESTQTDRSPCKGKSIMNGYFRLCRATVRFPDTRNKEKKDKSDSTCIGYSSTPIGLLQYSYRITPVLLIGLLQYLHWITPVLLLEYSSTSIRIYKSTDCFLRADAPSATSRCPIHSESSCPPTCPFTDYISLKRSLFINYT